MVLTLYKLNISPPARAVMTTIDALQIPDVKYVDVNLFEGEHYSEEYLKMNPQHTIPTLKDDDFCIWDSHAIILYLLGKYAKDHPLYPTDLKKKAVVDQRLHFDSGVLFPAVINASAALFLKHEKSIRQEFIEKIESAYDFTEKFLSMSKWMAGDELTIADICCGTSFTSLNVIHKIDEKKYPNITAWLNRCYELDYFKKNNEEGLKMATEMMKTILIKNNAN